MNASGQKTLGAVDAAIRAELTRAPRQPPAAGPAGFITISRQAGIDIQPLVEGLIGRLNELEPPGVSWSYWDSNLLQRVAQEHHLSQQLIVALEEVNGSWLKDLIEGIRVAPGEQEVDEFKVYRRVMLTIRGLAAMGRAVIVGRGGVFATRDMSGGIHVRLVSPLAERVRATAAAHRTTLERAQQLIAIEIRHRDAFYRRHWPNSSLDPESFSITLNTSMLTIGQSVEAIAALMSAKAKMAAAAPAPVTT
jgi:hypothetical protein